MDIDAVEQRPADLAQIALDYARRAAALARRRHRNRIGARADSN